MAGMDTATELTGVHLLAAASALAAEVHAGQVDALGAPYLGHINRVTAYAEGLRVRYALELDRFAVAATATLHDAVEDSDLTVVDLEDRGFPAEVVQAVALLTHVPHTPRGEYLQSIAADPLARVVKLADTWDNADPVRLRTVAENDPERAERLAAKYSEALRIIGGVPR